MVLAVLGASSLARRALRIRAVALEPLPMAVLLALALEAEHGASDGAAQELELGHALCCDGDELADAVGSLLAHELVLEVEEPFGDGERLVLSAAGANLLGPWLTAVRPLFAGWPPDQPALDDAS
jgi:hypothetical protein